jgi:hypothetical protein
MIKEEDRIWHLIALQLAGEACNEELQELDDLLKVNPDKYYMHEILHNAWGIPEVKNKEETAQAFERLLKKMETRGMNIIPYLSVEQPQ